MASNNHGQTSNGPVKVALWCVARSASTAFTKCICGIQDLEVHLEPYSYAATVSSIFAATGATGRHLPVEYVGNEGVYEEANDVWEKNTGGRLFPRIMSYKEIKKDLEGTEHSVFVKDVTAQLDLFRPYIPDGFRHTFLIRDPSRAFVSHRKCMIKQYRHLLPADLDEYDQVKHDVFGIKPKLWFQKQHELWEYVKENFEREPIIIDTSDLLTKPGPVLKAYLDAVGLPYRDELLDWEAEKIPDNLMMSGEDVFNEGFRTFYEVTLKSTCFTAPAESGPIPRDQLHNNVIPIVDHSMPFYEEMYAHRLQV